MLTPKGENLIMLDELTVQSVGSTKIRTNQERALTLWGTFDNVYTTSSGKFLGLFDKDNTKGLGVFGGMGISSDSNVNSQELGSLVPKQKNQEPGSLVSKQKKYVMQGIVAWGQISGKSIPIRRVSLIRRLSEDNGKDGITAVRGGSGALIGEIYPTFSDLQASQKTICSKTFLWHEGKGAEQYSTEYPTQSLVNTTIVNGLYQSHSALPNRSEIDSLSKRSDVFWDYSVIMIGPSMHDKLLLSSLVRSVARSAVSVKKLLGIESKAPSGRDGPASAAFGNKRVLAFLRDPAVQGNLHLSPSRGSEQDDTWSELDVAYLMKKSKLKEVFRSTSEMLSTGLVLMRDLPGNTFSEEVFSKPESETCFSLLNCVLGDWKAKKADERLTDCLFGNFDCCSSETTSAGEVKDEVGAFERRLQGMFGNVPPFFSSNFKRNLHGNSSDPQSKFTITSELIASSFLKELLSQSLGDSGIESGFPKKLQDAVNATIAKHYERSIEAATFKARQILQLNSQRGYQFSSKKETSSGALLQSFVELLGKTVAGWFYETVMWMLSEGLGEVILWHNNGKYQSVDAPERDGLLDAMGARAASLGIFGASAWYSAAQFCVSCQRSISSGAGAAFASFQKWKELHIEIYKGSAEEVKQHSADIVRFLQEDLSWRFKATSALMGASPGSRFSSSAKLEFLSDLRKQWVSRFGNTVNDATREEEEEGGEEEEKTSLEFQDWLAALGGISRIKLTERNLSGCFSRDDYHAIYRKSPAAWLERSDLLFLPEEHAKRCGRNAPPLLSNGGALFKYCRAIKVNYTRGEGEPLPDIQENNPAISKFYLFGRSDYPGVVRSRYEEANDGPWRPYAINIHGGRFGEVSKEIGFPGVAEDLVRPVSGKKGHYAEIYAFRCPHEYSFSTGDFGKMNPSLLGTVDELFSPVNGHSAFAPIKKGQFADNLHLFRGEDALREQARLLSLVVTKCKKILETRKGKVSSAFYQKYKNLVLVNEIVKSALFSLETETQDFSMEWHHGPDYQGALTFRGRSDLLFDPNAYDLSDADKNDEDYFFPKEGAIGTVELQKEFSLWLILDKVEGGLISDRAMHSSLDESKKIDWGAALYESSNSKILKGLGKKWADTTQLRKKKVSDVDQMRESYGKYFERSIANRRNEGAPRSHGSNFVLGGTKVYEHVSFEEMKHSTADFDALPGYLLMKICDLTLLFDEGESSVGEVQLDGFGNPSNVVLHTSIGAPVEELSSHLFAGAFETNEKLQVYTGLQYLSSAKRYCGPSTWLSKLRAGTGAGNVTKYMSGKHILIDWVGHPLKGTSLDFDARLQALDMFSWEKTEEHAPFRIFGNMGNIVKTIEGFLGKGTLGPPENQTWPTVLGKNCAVSLGAGCLFRSKTRMGLLPWIRNVYDRNRKVIGSRFGYENIAYPLDLLFGVPLSLSMWDDMQGISEYQSSENLAQAILSKRRDQAMSDGSETEEAGIWDPKFGPDSYKSLALLFDARILFVEYADQLYFEDDLSTRAYDKTIMLGEYQGQKGELETGLELQLLGERERMRGRVVLSYRYNSLKYFPWFRVGADFRSGKSKKVLVSRSLRRVELKLRSMLTPEHLEKKQLTLRLQRFDMVDLFKAASKCIAGRLCNAIFRSLRDAKTRTGTTASGVPLNSILGDLRSKFQLLVEGHQAVYDRQPDESLEHLVSMNGSQLDGETLASASAIDRFWKRRWYLAVRDGKPLQSTKYWSDLVPGPSEKISEQLMFFLLSGIRSYCVALRDVLSETGGSTEQESYKLEELTERLVALQYDYATVTKILSEAQTEGPEDDIFSVLTRTASGFGLSLSRVPSELLLLHVARECLLRIEKYKEVLELGVSALGAPSDKVLGSVTIPEFLKLWKNQDMQLKDPEGTECVEILERIFNNELYEPGRTTYFLIADPKAKGGKLNVVQAHEMGPKDVLQEATNDIGINILEKYEFFGSGGTGDRSYRGGSFWEVVEGALLDASLPFSRWENLTRTDLIDNFSHLFEAKDERNQKSLFKKLNPRGEFDLLDTLRDEYMVDVVLMLSLRFSDLIKMDPFKVASTDHSLKDAWADVVSKANGGVQKLWKNIVGIYAFEGQINI